MLREVAIKRIQDFTGWFKKDKPIYEALEMAIQALSQEPCDDATLKDIFCMGCEYREQEPCDDAISREAVIMECIKYADHEHNVQLKKEVSETRKHDAQVIIYACDYFKTFVEKLPSVTHKSGKWILTIEDWNKWTCSKCGYVKRTDIHVNIGWKYCPNCGAKMVEPQEQERSDQG